MSHAGTYADTNIEYHAMIRRLSHEFGNCFALHNLTIDLIRNACKTLSATNTAIADIEKSCDRLLKCSHKMNDVLQNELSDAKSDSKPVLKRIDLGDFLNKEIVELSNGFIDPSRININIPVNFIVKADATKLRHIFGNLIKNAAQACDPNSGRIEIYAGSDNNKRHIFVKDNGKGISPVILAKIFSEGFTTKSDGHGVGLALCRKYMERMGGKITCDSKLGEFTCFNLQFKE